MNTSARQPKPAPKPGVYHDIAAEEYHGWAAVNFSLLKEMDRSAAHARAWLDSEWDEPTDAMLFGSAYHCCALENGQFEKRYTVTPKFPRRSDADKKTWADLCEKAGGERFVLWQEDAERMRAMRDALLSHPQAKALIATEGRTECSFVWVDKPTGLTCKCRVDRLSRMDGAWTLLDLKSTADASSRAFALSCAEYRYHVQAPWYVDGVRAVTGKALPFAFIAQEKDPPYAAQPYMVEAPELEAGRRIYRVLLDRLAHCIKTGRWKTYEERPMALVLPDFIYRKAEEIAQ